MRALERSYLNYSANNGFFTMKPGHALSKHSANKFAAKGLTAMMSAAPTRLRLNPLRGFPGGTPLAANLFAVGAGRLLAPIFFDLRGQFQDHRLDTAHF